MLAKLAAPPQPDCAAGERLHVIVKASAPTHTPKPWYGIPAYARDGNVVCFFQSAKRFKTKGATRVRQPKCYLGGSVASD